MKLKEYNRKRNFKLTNEPKGRTNKKNNNLRFVIQFHQARAKHYDFRLEHEGVLLSWAVPKGLSLNPKDKRLAVMVEPHPIDYMNFEGIIPKGNYGAGTVEIFDKGYYTPLKDINKGLEKGHLKIILKGEKLNGEFSIVKIEQNNWLIIKSMDNFATNKQINKKIKNPFSFTSVQLASLSNKIPNGKDWIFEIKYDGYRILSIFENGNINLFTRNNKDYTHKFPSIKESLSKLNCQACILDGEIVVFDKNGKTDFSALQESIKKNLDNVYYVVFDLLALNGEDLRNLSLKQRKEKLERLVYNQANIIYSNHINDGKASFEFARQNNLEGIIAKKINSQYSGGRNGDWLKIKCYMRQEFIITGFTTTEKNKRLSALILGYYENQELKYVGKVGTGFSEKTKLELIKIFKPLLTKTSSFPTILKNENVHWLSPKLVAEIQFTELTKDKILRQPSFIALRLDKDAKEVKLEYS